MKAQAPTHRCGAVIVPRQQDALLCRLRGAYGGDEPHQPEAAQQHPAQRQQRVAAQQRAVQSTIDAQRFIQIPRAPDNGKQDTRVARRISDRSRLSST